MMTAYLKTPHSPWVAQGLEFSNLFYVLVATLRANVLPWGINEVRHQASSRRQRCEKTNSFKEYVFRGSSKIRLLTKSSYWHVHWGGR
jgi:hypothetical protein